MIHDLKPYPAYKDSGVPWLGEVPKHWNSEKIKNLARAGYKTFVDGDWIESPYITSDGIRLIQTGNIGVGVYKEKGFRYISEDTFNTFGCTEFEPNDVLICRLGDPVGRACLAPRLGARMITSVDVCILKPREDVNAAFLVYAKSSPQYLEWVRSLVRGSTRDRVSRSMLGTFSIPLPPLYEQAIIVRYLDYIDRRIRRYIRTKQKLIKLMEEQKKAIVHQAVTRGLDPNVQLKSSGVEWLGNVPEHWEVRQLGRFITLQRGFDVTKDQQVEGTVPVVSSGGVSSYHNQSTSSGPGVIVGRKGSVGTVHFVEGAYWAHDTTLWVKEFNGNHPKFVFYVLSNLDLKRFDTGSANPTINRNNVHPEIVSFPPIVEQYKIAHFLDRILEQNGKTIEHYLREISLLSEYRTRLIADVVTGKLDVREVAVNRPEETDEMETLDDALECDDETTDCYLELTADESIEEN